MKTKKPAEKVTEKVAEKADEQWYKLVAKITEMPERFDMQIVCDDCHKPIFNVSVIAAPWPTFLFGARTTCKDGVHTVEPQELPRHHIELTGKKAFDLIADWGTVPPLDVEAVTAKDSGEKSNG